MSESARDFESSPSQTGVVAAFGSARPRESAGGAADPGRPARVPAQAVRVESDSEGTDHGRRPPAGRRPGTMPGFQLIKTDGRGLSSTRAGTNLPYGRKIYGQMCVCSGGSWSDRAHTIYLLYKRHIT